MTFTIQTEDSVNKMVTTILNDFADTTGLACVYVDVKGKEKSYQYNFSKFCQMMRRDSVYRHKCNHCDLCGSMAMFKQNVFCPHRCHAGLVDFSVPIVQNNTLYGFIMAGQTASQDTRIPAIRMATNLNALAGAEKYYKEVPQYSYDQIMSAMRILRSMTLAYFFFSEQSVTVSLRQQFGKDLAAIIVSKTIRPEIQNAADYVKKHLYAKLSLRTIAEQVYLSEAYLSKVFKEEMNMNLSQYINSCRIEEAQKILRKSGISVELLSRQLGYNQPSYFCKIFKQFTGETPHVYRKKHQLG